MFDAGRSESECPADSRLLSLLELFPGDWLTPSGMEGVSALHVPEPYRRLLVNRHHMTVTLEEHHGSPVRLEVLARRDGGADYARKLILRAGPENRVVLAGIMRFHLQHANREVRRAIFDERVPLGRILSENDVLRRIEPYAFLRIRLSHGLHRIFSALPSAAVTFGRVACIYCHNSPAVELLEIAAPEPIASKLAPEESGA